MDVFARKQAGEPTGVLYSAKDMADDIVGLMDGLNINKAHVMGISMGGMIVQLLAAVHGDRVISMTSIMSSSGDPSMPSAMPEVQAVLMAAPENDDRETVVAHAIKGQRVFESPAYSETDEFLYDVFGAAFDRCYCPEGVARQMSAVIDSGDRSEALKTIKVPSLVIHGADDVLVPLACGIDTAEKIPGAKLEVIDGMGHDVPLALVPRWIELISTHAKQAKS